MSLRCTNVAHFSIFRACEKCILDGYVVYISTIMVHACMYTCMTLTYFLNNGKHCIDVKFSIKTILRLLDNLWNGESLDVQVDIVRGFFGAQEYNEFCMLV